MDNSEEISQKTAKTISGISLMLASTSVFVGLSLSSSLASAEDIVDDVSLTVPTSCSMSGSGMNTHSAEIPNGTYEANIGTTTINAVCNDNAGFSIYASGYSGEIVGGDNSNKLIGTNVNNNSTIDTGTATSAGDPDISNWAMKLATDSQATYPLTLTTGYNAYHAVPNEYTKVATRLSGTDSGASATGSTFTTTYAAYISRTQPADAYTGKVIYTLVHPNTAPTPEPPIPTGYENSPIHLVIVTPPTKTTYDDGELIDASGMKVRAVFEDGREWYTVPNDRITLINSVANINQSDYGQETSNVIRYGANIYVPYYESQHAWDNRGYSTMQELLSYHPELSVDATLFTADNEIRDVFRNFGFPHVFSCEELNGQVWTVGNLSATFSYQSETVNGYNEGWVSYSNGHSSGIRGVKGLADDANVGAFSFPTSNVLSGHMGTGQYEMTISYSKNGKIYVYRDPYYQNGDGNIYAGTSEYHGGFQAVSVHWTSTNGETLETSFNIIVEE